MNDMLPPPTRLGATGVAGEETPVTQQTGSHGERWVTAVVAVLAVDVVAVIIGTIGFVGWFALLWNGQIGESLAVPVLAACMAPAVVVWVASGWWASRLTGDPRAWWLLTLVPAVGAALLALAAL